MQKRKTFWVRQLPSKLPQNTNIFLEIAKGAIKGVLIETAVSLYRDIRIFLTFLIYFYPSLNLPLRSKFPGILRLLESKYTGKLGL